MKQEIERKYAVKYIPENINFDKIINIEQFFIYHDKRTLIRLRKIAEINNTLNVNTEYIYTLKTTGDIQYDNSYSMGRKYEIESNIEEKEYSSLIGRKISNTINKTRIVIPIPNKLKAEIDVFHGYLEGLITVEVEFEDLNQANNFLKPDWFGEELGYKELSNRKLSEMTKEEFESKVTKEFMENNRKILKELKNNKVIKF